MAAWLRARSFYAYPPERKFAGEVSRWFLEGTLAASPALPGEA